MKRVVMVAFFVLAGFFSLKAEIESTDQSVDRPVKTVRETVPGGKEAFRIVFTPEEIRLSGADDTALRYAQTMLGQMEKRQREGIITESPRNEVRGVLIDVARRFVALDDLRDLVEVMAYYRMNELHIHLNDNLNHAYSNGDYKKAPAFFRLECETYPGLTSKEHYTKAEFRAFMQWAAEQGVTVLPEIDTPAHSVVFTQYRPALGSERFGFNHLDLNNPAVIPFVEKLWDEYIGGENPVFIGEEVHIGMDEYDPAEAETFRAYMDHLIGFVQSRGKKVRAWGALSHAKGSTPVRTEGVTLDVWNHTFQDPQAALDAGFRIVSAPGKLVYLVPCATYFNDAIDPVKLIRNWEPRRVGQRLHPPEDIRIRGGKIALWNDLPQNGVGWKEMFDRLFPAIQAASHITWSGADSGMTPQAFDARYGSLPEAPGLDILGRRALMGDPEGREAGYSLPGGYRVSLTVTPDNATGDLPLLRSKTAALFGRYGEKGTLAFVRDGYTFAFETVLQPEKETRLTFYGTRSGVSLWIDGAFAEALTPKTLSFPNTTRKVEQRPAVVFPLTLTPEAATWKTAILGVRPGPEPSRLPPSAIPKLTGFRQSETPGALEKTLPVIEKLTPDPALGEEGFRLSISEAGVTVNAATRHGLLWGRQTLRQMQTGGPLPFGETVEIPAYAERGFMIDVGRKFVRISFLRDLVKLMSYYRMNTLHVHLNDNAFKQFFENNWDETAAFFRLECETYPGLTSEEHYTKAEFREFVKEAAALGVNVIPEIDSPAHSLRFVHYRKSLGSKAYGDDHLDLENPEVLPFMKALLDEYITGLDPVFGGPIVHVGGDEYSREKADVFREYMRELIAHVKAAGKTPRCWSEASCLRPPSVYTDGVQLDVWNRPKENLSSLGDADVALIAIPDHLLYIVPTAHYYHDWLNLENLYKTWTPNVFGRGVAIEADHPKLRGSKFALWNDRWNNGVGEKEMIARIFPAMQVLSEKMWHGAHAAFDWTEFNTRAARILEPETTDFGFSRAAAGYPLRFPELSGKYTTDGELRKGQIPEIGWFMGRSPVLSFRIRPEADSGEAVLFRSYNAVFYLRTGETGLPGFSRDGYTFTFNTPIPTGVWSVVTVALTPEDVTLTVNGKAETLAPRRLSFKGTEETVLQKRTLFFPLGEAGGFNGELDDVKIIRQ